MLFAFAVAALALNISKSALGAFPVYCNNSYYVATSEVMYQCDRMNCKEEIFPDSLKQLKPICNNEELAYIRLKSGFIYKYGRDFKLQSHEALTVYRAHVKLHSGVLYYKNGSLFLHEYGVGTVDSVYVGYGIAEPSADNIIVNLKDTLLVASGNSGKISMESFSAKGSMAPGFDWESAPGSMEKDRWVIYLKAEKRLSWIMPDENGRGLILWEKETNGEWLKKGMCHNCFRFGFLNNGEYWAVSGLHPKPAVLRIGAIHDLFVD